MSTQLEAARAGTVTNEIRFVAEAEKLGNEVVQENVAAGTVVIPANKLHLASNLQPAGVGRVLSTKVNANIGTSSISSSIEAEIEKWLRSYDPPIISRVEKDRALLDVRTIQDRELKTVAQALKELAGVIPKAAPASSS